MVNLAFHTDYYELTMLQSALEDGTAETPAVFEMFARKLPAGRRYGVVAGTARAIQAIQDYRFTEQHIQWLRDATSLSDETLEYLAHYRFDGTVTGLREGDIYFPNTPILTVETTFGAGILLETMLLSIFNYDSAVASAASRMVQAAQQADRDITLIEMGSRRINEHAAVSAARAAYLVGFDATSNIQAGFEYGIPVRGTSAHAYTLAHESELEAFHTQVTSHGTGTTLLVDTYDIGEGIDHAVAAGGPNLGGIRIDSGDLYEETMKARARLDAYGNTETKITLSSDIDEYAIQELVERGTPVDGLGVGTRVVTGSGHPAAGMVYKLVAIERNGTFVPVAKKAAEKQSYGGKKAVYRNPDQKMEYVVIDEAIPPVEMRKRTVTLIEDGVATDAPSLEDSRAFHHRVMQALAPEHKAIPAGTPAYFTTFLR